MTRSSLFVTASLACTALLSGGPLLAAGANDPLVPGRHGVRGMKHMAAELGLSQDQIKEIADLRTRHWNAGLGQAAADSRAALVAARQAVHDPAAQEPQIAAAVQKANEAATRFAIERHRLFVDIWNVLTPDQRLKLQDLLSRRQQWGDRVFGGLDGFMSGTGPHGRGQEERPGPDRS